MSYESWPVSVGSTAGLSLYNYYLWPFCGSSASDNTFSFTSARPQRWSRGLSSCLTYTFVDSRGPDPQGGHVRRLSRLPHVHVRWLSSSQPTGGHVRRLSRSHSLSLILVMFSHRELVTPAIVRTYRYVVYCAGGPPPGIVSCAYAIYSFLFMAAYCLLPLLVRVHGYSRSCFLCMCKCMCRHCMMR